ncbi:hypothetical protein ABIF90_000640 [Bradyrhizobium japonicum]
MPSEEKPLAADATTTTCVNCDDLGWVCENHPDRPLGRPARLHLWRRWRTLPGLQRRWRR